jgi:hypothetical protein
MTKTLDDSFIDWEGEAFGFGYGSGEEHTLGALKQFFGLLEDGRSYDYRCLEREMTPTVAWLMINALCRDGIIDYGVSPRHGWLAENGQRLKTYVDGKTLAELQAVLHVGQDHIHCYKDACNCGPNGYEKGRVCANPFWRRYPL